MTNHDAQLVADYLASSQHRKATALTAFANATAEYVLDNLYDVPLAMLCVWPSRQARHAIYLARRTCERQGMSRAEFHDTVPYAQPVIDGECRLTLEHIRDLSIVTGLTEDELTYHYEIGSRQARQRLRAMHRLLGWEGAFREDRRRIA